jgi:alginate O-acetyltransferase complex protein AlgI
MLFNSPIYLLFLALTVGLYWLMPHRLRVLLLLIASLVFYMSWSPPHGLIYGPMLLLDTACVYGLSLAMIRYRAQQKALLAVGVTAQLLLLGVFKYANFASDFWASLLQLAHPAAAAPVHFNIFLPLAISFTTFVLISYLIDVYRGKETPDPSFIRFAAYVFFFPHLIAGPIVRASELLRQCDNPPPFNTSRFADGIHRFCTGFFLKVFIADLIAPYADLIFSHPQYQGFNTAWTAVYAFSIQLFCDFFGYTLMAQGSAQLMGFTLPENFNAPYFAKNMSEYWSRWHMTLSRWLRDYLYIPLGGNRQGRFNTYRNLFITMGLGGLWHGANWTFVAWGLLNGIFLCAQKVAQRWGITRFVPAWLALLLTWHAVCLTRVFFRAENFSIAWTMLKAMANPLHWVRLPIAEGSVEQSAVTSTGTTLVLILLFLGGHALVRYLRPRVQQPFFREAGIAVAYGIFLYCLCTLGGQAGQQFIYFQF